MGATREEDQLLDKYLGGSNPISAISDHIQSLGIQHK
jgi:hypothetical protein